MKWIRQTIRFIVLLLLQVLLINNLRISGYCHPYLYVACLLVMPITLPRWVDLIIGAFVGLILDAFCNSAGVHMAACTMVMLIRPYLIERMVVESERLTDEINISSIGPTSFSIYAAILIAAHHVVVFFLTNWFHSVLFTLGQITVSAAITYGLVIGYEFLRKK
ncbi:MAG: rod shape-determining protein MreD [Paludibacteraceae bacterium]|nr:rod shape-determining protein MreD [Paludibacteraceae bacterium]